MPVVFDGTNRPRVQVLAGFGGLLDPGAGYIHLGVGPGLGTGLLSGPAAGTNEIDITADVRSISLSLRGRSSDLDAASPVTCQITLNNQHGDYDPSNAASPYAGQLEDGTPIRVRASWAGIAYDRFYGELSDITLDLDATPAVTVTFEAADGLEKLGLAYLPEVTRTRDGDTTGERVSWLADEAAYPSSLRAIDTGYTTLGPTIAGETAAELMRRVEATEYGLLFAAGDGDLTFYERHRGVTATRSTTVQATFGDTGVRIPALQLARSRARTFNRVAITRDPTPHLEVAPPTGTEEPESSDDEPVEQVADDFTTQATKGVLAFPTEAGQLSRSDFEALALAQYLVARYKTTTNRISEIQVNALRGDWATLLSLGPLDRVEVEQDYGPSTVLTELHVQGVSEDIGVNPPQWNLTFTTSPPPPAAGLFILGTGQVGNSGNGRLGW